MTVVVPFAGTDAQLGELRSDASTASALTPADELIVADNRSDPVRTPGFARNKGADGARGEWLVFLDADTIPEPDLLDRVLRSRRRARSTAVLAGRDQRRRAPPDGGRTREAPRGQRMSQRATLERPGTPYAQTANCAIRRDAFELAGGFDPSARAGEDADLCFRLQRARVGARGASGRGRRAPQPRVAGGVAGPDARAMGAARRGSSAGGRASSRARDRGGSRGGSRGRRCEAAEAAVRGEREEAVGAVLEIAGAAAFELGRLLPNTRGARAERMSS